MGGIYTNLKEFYGPRSGKRKLNSIEVIDVLTDLFILRGIPGYIRSDNGPKFIAEALRDWIRTVGAKAYIEPGPL